MAHGGFRRFVPQGTAHGPAGQGLKCGRADEMRRALGHDDLHLGVSVLKSPHQIRRLVGGDARADTEEDALAGQVAQGGFLRRRRD